MSTRNFDLLLILVWFFNSAFSIPTNNVQSIINGINIGNTAGFLNPQIRLINFETNIHDVNTPIAVINLKSAVDRLEQSHQFYTGSAKSDLLKVKQTTDTLMSQYHLATDEMYKWAVFASDRLGFIVQFDATLQNRNQVKQLTRTILDNTVTTTDATVCTLNAIVESLIELKYQLKRIELAIRRESGENSCSCQNGCDCTSNVMNAIENVINEVTAIQTKLGQQNSGKCEEAVGRMDEVKYLTTFSSQAAEMRNRLDILYDDEFSWIIREIGMFASKLNGYVKRHSGSAIFHLSRANRRRYRLMN